MRLTAPQKKILLENQPTIEDYELAIKRKPGALERYLDLAKRNGFSNNDLKNLLGYALRNNIIDMATFKFHESRLELAKTRKLRKTGRLDPRDSSIHSDDEDDSMTVKCIKCKKSIMANQASLGKSGWVCTRCQ